MYSLVQDTADAPAPFTTIFTSSMRLPATSSALSSPALEMTGDDGGAVLVVVHDGDVQLFLQPAFNLEALGCFDVFQVDASEGGCDGFDGFDKLVGVFLVHLDVEHVDACVYLEQQSFAFHHGFSRKGSYVAQSQDGGAVGDDSYEIPFGGVFVSVDGVLFDFQTWLCHSGRVGEREVGLCAVGFGRYYFDFSGLAHRVVEQGGFFGYFCHTCI